MNPQSGQSKPLQLTSVLAESWHLVNGLKMPVFIMMLLWFAASTLISFIAMLFLIFLPTPPIFSWQLAHLIVGYLTFLLCAIIIILGINRATNRAVELGAASKVVLQVKAKLFFLYLLLFLISFIGTLPVFYDSQFGLLPFYLATLGIIYLSTPLYFFAAPLIILKRYDLFTAIKSAYIEAHRNFVVVYFASLIIILCCYAFYFLSGRLGFFNYSYFILGIALILGAPMLSALAGVLFRDIYQYQSLPEKTANSITKSSVSADEKYEVAAKMMLLFVTVISCMVAPFLGGAIMMSPMIFDAGMTPGKEMLFYSLFLLPIYMGFSIIFGWMLYKEKRYVACLYLNFIPTIICFFILWGVILNRLV